MLPFVAAAGEWSAIPGNLIAMGLALLCAGGVYACCMRGGMQPVTCAFFTLFVSMGSNVFWMSTSDGVWFLAQVCALGFAFWGLFFAQGGNAVQDAAASLCMALAVGCRPFYALLLACWLGWQFYQRRSLKRILPALLPAVVMAACMMAYNFARFGSVTEFGHNYLPEFVRAENGQFSLTYLVPNLLQLLRRSHWTRRDSCTLRYTMDFCSLLPTRFSCWRWYADCCCACPGTRRKCRSVFHCHQRGGLLRRCAC